ncbi:cytochrome c3 family protein [Arenicella xantha]|uniref:Putative CXXCH cytochrome family protein n=1 Tax=Arenicella xantha TaxID=644221 RepID=A0A395JHL0_9GAMM|nr:cytochrome c3 family protein [Arenicella xantha]RBP47135.1 putative CXXCH cytochrome family protein [Arenicella xantha]
MEDRNKKNNSPLSLEETNLSRRWPSWVLLAGILLLFLVVPIVSLMSGQLSSFLRSSPLPSDNAWISGPLSSAHKIPELNQNCQACHTVPFQKVQDDTCLTCHADAQQHIDGEMHPVVNLDEVRCASCHREHNKPANLVRHDDQLCIGCHEDLSESGLETALEDVGGFGLEHREKGKPAPHPALSVSILTAEGVPGSMTWHAERAKLADNPVENSNLSFPHDVHLDAAGVDGPDGNTQLVCNDCHVTDGAGELMRPISMENNCRACHTLVFDPDAPERELPHGDPAQVVLALEEFYARQFLRNSLGRAPTQEEIQDFVLRRPGGSVKQRGAQALTMAEPWGKARSVAEEVFTRTTCKTCHEISQTSDADGALSWQVAEVKLTEQWMTKSVFNHRSHRSSDCSLCHAAAESEQATDVLMPDMPVCDSCHTGVRSHESKTPTSCIACHEFHRPALAPWRSGERPLEQALRDSASKPSKASTNL